jgi:hypothetical protein
VAESAGQSALARRLGPLASRPAWPVTALLVGYPLWWALGVADFMWVILAIPMLHRMVGWRRHGRRIQMPPGFVLWAMFLIVAFAGIAELTLNSPGTVASPVSHRLLSYANRNVYYLGVTVLLVYVGNLTERELPRRAVAWMLGLVAVYTVAGGLAGMALPNFEFSSPVLALLPKSVAANPFIQASMHPALTQVQNVLGTAGGRPKAPFDYTNTWGNCLVILVPFLLVGRWWYGTRRSRLFAAGTLIIAVMPLLYSLNRDAWIAVLASAGYLAIRLAARGRVALLGALCAAVGVLALLILLTPLSSVVTGRLHNGKSNDLRANLDSLSVTAGLISPIIGYGDTRQEAGSPASIAIGPSQKCLVCGQLEVGSTGQLWLLLVCDGFVGAALYLAFFAYAVWRYRHDSSPYGFAGLLVLLLSFVFMFAYDATGAPLGFTMVAFGLLWKNDLQRPAVPAAPGEVLRGQPTPAFGPDRQPAPGAVPQLVAGSPR